MRKALVLVSRRHLGFQFKAVRFSWSTWESLIDCFEGDSFEGKGRGRQKWWEERPRWRESRTWPVGRLKNSCKLLNFEIAVDGVEATQLYHDVKYTIVDEYLNTFVWIMPDFLQQTYFLSRKVEIRLIWVTMSFSSSCESYQFNV